MTTAGVVDRQRLTLELTAADVPNAEALLTLAGAETIALHDAADDPVLEPEPNTAPLWPNVVLHALYASDVDLEPLRKVLAGAFPASAVRIDVLPESAWARGLQQAGGARPIGARLWLAPASDTRIPEGRTAVHINMGLAFGTGEHPTTSLCLEWLESHVESGSTVLDYGCGTGVLALAALALGARRAFAVDNDNQALIATRANAELNGVAERLYIGAPEELPAVTVDVLAANILAEPLVALATTFAKHVRPGGRLVLSGILEAQAARVGAAYQPHFHDFEQSARDGWVRLTARRNAG